MIPAFHRVRQKSFDDVLASGLILPARARISRGDVLELCTNFIGSQEAWDPAPNATRAITRLAKKVPASSRATPHPTMFGCMDALAGDLEYVFLSMPRWVSFYQPEESRIYGFVYSAEALIDAGAYYRSHDFDEEYRSAADQVLFRKHQSEAEASQQLSRALGRIKSQQMSGKKAMQALRENRSGEIAWEGPLPVPWATEVVDGAFEGNH